jgi:hypothetical protein
MGFDVYGIKPIENTPKPEILTQEPWEIKDEELKKEWYKADDKWEEENPGVYFRNNVWWWRPLWDYVVEVCEDVMTASEAEAGYSNSHLEISAESVDKMLSKLVPEMAFGNHITYGDEYKAKLDALALIDCDLCNATGIRDDAHVQGECNGCAGEGKRKSWDTHYPFSHKNVESFVNFLSESGGIRIC